MPVKLEGFSGGDRTSIDLPAAQEDLLKALSATGKPLVVVLQNGSALAVNWAQQHANGVLEAWYPGEEGGTAIAETLAGDNNPAGRLPLTFYSSLSQVPPFEEYSMKGRTYRYLSEKPLYGFGFGLSYTKFAYSGLQIAKTVKAGESVTVEADVKNTGGVAGDEVVEALSRATQGFRNSSARAGWIQTRSFGGRPVGACQADAGSPLFRPGGCRRESSDRAGGIHGLGRRSAAGRDRLGSDQQVRNRGASDTPQIEN